jgi:hypothetical protein
LIIADLVQLHELVVEFASDFGDLFECRTRPEKRAGCRRTWDRVTLRYEREGFVRETVIRFSASAPSRPIARGSMRRPARARAGRPASTSFPSWMGVERPSKSSARAEPSTRTIASKES